MGRETTTRIRNWLEGHGARSGTTSGNSAATTIFRGLSLKERKMLWSRQISFTIAPAYLMISVNSARHNIWVSRHSLKATYHAVCRWINRILPIPTRVCVYPREMAGIWVHKYFKFSISRVYEYMKKIILAQIF